MQRLILPLCSLLLFWACNKDCPTDNCIEKAAPVVRFYGGGTGVSNQIASDFVPSHTPGNYTILGTSNAFNSEKQDELWLFEVDEAGRTLSNMLGSQDTLYAYGQKLIKTNDSYLILANTVQTEGFIEESESQIIEVQAGGGLDVSTKTVTNLKEGDPHKYFLSDAILTADGGLVVVGETTKINQAKNGWSPTFAEVDRTDLYIAKYTPVIGGWELQWEYSYGYLYEDVAVTIDAYQGGFLVSAINVIDQGGDKYQELSVYFINSFGGLTEHKRIHRATSEYPHIASYDLDVLPDESNFYLLYGIAPPLLQTQPESYIYEYAKDSSTLMSLVVVSEKDGVAEAGVELVEATSMVANDTSLILGGRGEFVGNGIFILDPEYELNRNLWMGNLAATTFIKNSILEADNELVLLGENPMNTGSGAVPYIMFLKQSLNLPNQ